MRKTFLLIVLLLAAVYAHGQAGKKTADTVFIKRAFGDNGTYRAVYIENNRSSKYYDWIADFENKDYNTTLHYLKDYKIKLHRHNIYDIPKKWCKLIVYKGNYYAYAPSDFGFNYKFEINDSAIIEYGMEGGIVSAIISAEKISAKHYRLKIKRIDQEKGDGNTLITTTDIYIADPDKKIAVFESGYWPYRELMVPAENLKDFPIIINYSPANKAKEFRSDTIDYKGLISKSNQ